MQTAGHYRARAEECVQLAERAPPDERRKLLEIATAWVKLADAAEAQEANTVTATAVSLRNQ